MNDVKYCYPASSVLKNKLNIKDSQTLEEVERKIVGCKLIKLAQEPVKGDYDFQHLQSIHKELFGDIYSWAGQVRTVNIAKGEMFCNATYLQEYGNDIFRKIKKDNYLLDKPQGEVVKSLAEYMGDINALHPFREGNGRTQRYFISELANVAGFHIDYNKVDKQEMLEASIDSLYCRFEKMENIFEKIITPCSSLEQKQFIEKMPELIKNKSVALSKSGKLIDREREAIKNKAMEKLTKNRSSRGKDNELER